MRTFEISLPKEIRIWIILFLIAEILNVAAIIIYKTEWKELYTQLGFVFIFTCFLYLFVGIIRFIIVLVKKSRAV